MSIPVPVPKSGGIMLTYKCSATCRHCMYACSPRWPADWISEEALTDMITTIAPSIEAAPFGQGAVSLNHGLHFTGGEPFLNFDLLSRGTEIASNSGIPSLFVETNSSWASDDTTTYEKLSGLKDKGMQGILISVNPFYLENIPFDRTERAIRISHEVFGRNSFVYQQTYYNRFKELDIHGTMPLEEYLQIENKPEFGRNVEFFLNGRSPYAMEKFSIFPQYRARYFFDEPCVPSFLRSWHNHFDNYGNYMPGYCGGISFGKASDLPELLQNGLDEDSHPVLSFIVDDDFEGLFDFAASYGYTEREKGYLSKCHLCADIRKHLVGKGEFSELRPKEFYNHLR